MRRGDVYKANLDPTVGSEIHKTRPVVIVSRDAINASSPVVIIVPVTSRSNKVRIYPTHVELRIGEGGLPSESVALCEQVRAISKDRLSGQLGQLPKPKVAQINASLKIALDLDS
ncbi:MAG TPA: type II toxin-antitoxin system PemK/MazF family toxin [Candidatus Dormibacteraeota bacterium]|nr:type II toxin-antitoxin system PemK/MazF family toxin [Candidatus Dormibacteraeota bacterium]